MASNAAATAKTRDFHHPFQPYDIQIQFMNAVYDCCENGKVGIFESPTGTGKSLSLLCGSLTWLRDFKRRSFEGDIDNDSNDENEPDWLVASAKRRKQQDALSRKKEQDKRLKTIRDKEGKARARFDSGLNSAKRQKTENDATTLDADEEAEFLLNEYESDEERVDSSNSNHSSALGLSVGTQALMEKLGLNLSKTDDRSQDREDELKIYFCSRTHSQLGQFTGELRRVKMPPSIPAPPDAKSADETILSEELKHITLGSRKQLCIDPKVNKLSSVTAMNERCLELQQSGTSLESRCHYLPNKETEVLVHDFRDHALSRIRDVEDFGKLGKHIGICPYYASRAAVEPAEIVTLPYPLLLQKSARQALNLSLKGHIVIVDEAHNLMDAISNIHSVEISLSQLKLSRTQLSIYLQKFRNKLKGKNRVYVTQLVRLIDSLSSFLESKLSSKSKESQIYVADLMTAKGVDQINLYKLMEYLQESRLARKVDGYIIHIEQQSSKADEKGGGKSTQPKNAVSMPALTHVQSFLSALTNPAEEGRFFFNKMENGHHFVDDDVQLRYRLLDPTYHFKEIVDEARAVILAGGTMSPMSDYTAHLLHYLPPERLQTLSCGHIIPPSNLLVLPISKGANGGELNFSFEKRNSESMVIELGESILQIACSVPDGVVVFFPSYAYLDRAVQTWQRLSSSTAQSTDNTIWSKLVSHKRIFLEPKSTLSSAPSPTQHPFPQAASATLSTSHPAHSSTADTILASYAAHIHATEPGQGHGGGLMLAVIGGSLSEGINFSDRLGRAVVVVGLPFPNARSPEWKAKMEFVAQRSRRDATETTDAASITQGVADAAAREYYENACMRAVNQSIGRAIRHRGDYAAIVLLDSRYERASLRGKLPEWIKRSIVGGRSIDDGVEAMQRFFSGKREVVVSAEGRTVS